MGLRETGGESPHSPRLTFRQLARAVTDILRLGDWFDDFGNYTRAHDCRRLADGISLYSEEMTGRAMPDPNNTARVARHRKARALGQEHVAGYLPPKRAAKVRQWLAEAETEAERLVTKAQQRD